MKNIIKTILLTICALIVLSTFSLFLSCQLAPDFASLAREAGWLIANVTPTAKSSMTAVASFVRATTSPTIMPMIASSATQIVATPTASPQSFDPSAGDRKLSAPEQNKSATPIVLRATATPQAFDFSIGSGHRKRENKMGVHLLLDDGRNVWPVDLWPIHLQYARQGVGEWGYVTQLVRLDDLDSRRWQIFMDLCTQLHLTPILRLATTFDREAGWWNAPPPDEGAGASKEHTYRSVAARYAAFVAALRWPTNEHYVIVGNEPNHGNEWGGRPDPKAYARFLIDLSQAMHEVDSEVHVLNAGFDPYTPHTGSVPWIDGMYNMDEETFLDQMYAAYPEVFDHIDIWASHPYPLGPFLEGPWHQTYRIDLINDAVNSKHVDPPAGIYNRGVNGYQWELFKLSTYGVPALPVMITETGWRHAESSDSAATDNGRPLPQAATTAQYLDLALHGNNGRYPDLPEEGWMPWLKDPNVIAITPFAFNGLPAEWGHTNWLALDTEGNVLDTYAVFKLLSRDQ